MSNYFTIETRGRSVPMVKATVLAALAANPSYTANDISGFVFHDELSSAAIRQHISWLRERSMLVDASDKRVRRRIAADGRTRTDDDHDYNWMVTGLGESVVDQYHDMLDQLARQAGRWYDDRIVFVPLGADR